MDVLSSRNKEWKGDSSSSSIHKLLLTHSHWQCGEQGWKTEVPHSWFKAQDVYFFTCAMQEKQKSEKDFIYSFIVLLFNEKVKEK